MPLYNGARWVEESIRSVLAQTLPPNEFIVVDDGSTDKGPEIVERLAGGHPLIRLMRKANGGQSAARNFAVRHSTSAFIALIDQDDRWYPNHLADLMGAVRDHKGPPLGWVLATLTMSTNTANLSDAALSITSPIRSAISFGFSPKA
jgi:glycosyltransferase involved in cell wall biosynthesis